VYVESAPGRGSTFIVLLPAVDEAAGAASAHASPQAPHRAHAGETILVVEDEATVRGTVRRMLERGGYRVLEARHGADALELLGDPATAPDLVLSDVVMPEMGANALIARLRERNVNTRILLMSGYSSEAVAGQSGLARDVELLAKPFTPDDLLRRVRAALDATPRA
jgi:CheY-like chemotaxis protein